MVSAAPPTLLGQFVTSSVVKFDLDSADITLAEKLPFSPVDATSNQAIVSQALFDPANKAFVEDIIRSNPSTPFDVFTLIHVKFAKLMLPYISGRVLSQTTPTKPHDKDAIIAHARAYAKAYNAEGIDNSRFAIKIPTTTAGVQAAAVLQAEGIQTLGTALFSVSQALAAAQAGMYAISPYFNQIKAFGDKTLWPDVADPGLEHPMAYRMMAIREAYDALARDGKQVPHIKGAAYLTGPEVLAQAELGCDHVTVLPSGLEDMMWATGVSVHVAGNWGKTFAETEPACGGAWTAPNKKEVEERNAVRRKKGDALGKENVLEGADYLADGVLDAANEADPATKQRLADAVEFFCEAEAKALAFIEEIQKRV